MKKLTVLAEVVAFTVFSPTTGWADCLIKLQDLTVPKSVNAGKPYKVAMSFSQEGNPKIIQGQFWWNSEGPFTFKVSKQKTIQAYLRTLNPRNYLLSARVTYRCGGKIRQTGKVASKLRVKP